MNKIYKTIKNGIMNALYANADLRGLNQKEYKEKTNSDLISYDINDIQKNIEDDLKRKVKQQWNQRHIENNKEFFIDEPIPNPLQQDFSWINKLVYQRGEEPDRKMGSREHP